MQLSWWMLADHAEVADGKWFINGGGWEWVVPNFPYYIALEFELAWDELDVSHPFTVELLDGKGTPVNAPNGQPMVHIEGQIRGERQPGVILGSATRPKLALGVPPLPLKPGQYGWHITVEGNDLFWALPFTVTAAGPQRLAS